MSEERPGLRFLKGIGNLFSDAPSLRAISLSEAYPSSRRHRLLDAREVATPETQDMSFSDFYSTHDSPTHRTRQVYTALLDDVRFCPTNNVITTPDRTIIKESAGPGAEPFGVDEAAIDRKDRVEPIEGLCTAFRCSFNNYYHLLVDLLSRFDLLNLAYFSRYERIKLLCPGGLRPLEKYFVSKLCPPNVTVIPIEKGVLYRPDRYLFLSFPTRRASAFIPGPYVDRLRERTLHDNVGRRNRRIYISRRKASERRVGNEGALVDRLRSLGFARYELEDLSPAQQIRLFQKAEVVVGPHGAGLANLLFATDATVLELQPSTTVATHFYFLCKRLGHSYHYLTHDAEAIDDDFRVDPDIVASTVASLLT